MPFLTPILAPIVAELQATREASESKDKAIERQADEIATLREERGRQGAEVEAERRAREQFVIERDAAEASRRRDARRLRIVVVVAGVLAIAAILAPAAGMVAR